MKKRILTIMTVIMMIMICFSGISVNAQTTIQPFDTVIVLDISGSMDAEMADMKSSAIKFCSDILAANSGNKIAVVAFADDAKMACDMTNDINTLTAAINGLSVSGTTNMTAGCQTAYNIITGSTSVNKIKNVIIMADGCPCTGEYLDSGKYNTIFPNIEVKYENKVYDYVSANLHPIANVYTVGFFGNIDASQPTLYDEYTQLSIQLMNDLSNTSSYFPTSADNMFDGIADNMINNSGNNTEQPASSTVTVIVCVGAAGGGIGIIAMIIFLATRKPPVPPAPIMTPILPIIVDDDDDDDNNNNRKYTDDTPPVGIERFAAEAGAIRNDGYYVVPNVSGAKVYGISGTYRNFDFDVKDGEVIRIGRDPVSCNLVITEDTSKVSRMHCTITYNAAQRCFVVTDMSKNGTFTKTVKLPYNVPTNISCGSEIQLADSCNIFRLG